MSEKDNKLLTLSQKNKAKHFLFAITQQAEWESAVICLKLVSNDLITRGKHYYII